MTDELTDEKEELVAQYLEAARADGDDKELAKLTVLLDALYWKLVRQILQRSITPNDEALRFSEDDRLLLDFGLLDPRLVKGAPAGLRQELLREAGLVGAPNHFYLSEWLNDRFKKYQVEAEMGGTEAAPAGGDVYQELLNYLSRLNGGLKLPGVTPAALAAMFSGRLDAQIIAMGAGALKSRSRREFLNRGRLASLRRDIISRSRGLVTDREQLALFDAVDRVYHEEWEKAVRPGGATAAAVSAESAADAGKTEKAFTWLLSELQFVRTLLPLGALAGGIFRSCAVMLEYRPRVTKLHTQRISQRAGWCDRNFAVPPVVLIAPFTGRGIYEWDRDSLVISLLPVDNPDDSAANAVANFCMLVDSFQRNGIIKDTYRAQFPKTNFQKEFQADYRTWMCAVAHGNRSALPPEKLEFFAANVAPDFVSSPALALAPRELKTLTFTARDLVRKQMQRQVSTARDSWMTRWRLGILYWLDKFNDEAVKELVCAANLAPDALETYFAVACILLETGRADKAKQLFTVCQARGKNTIWSFHAARALQKMF